MGRDENMKEIGRQQERARYPSLHEKKEIFSLDKIKALEKAIGRHLYHQESLKNEADNTKRIIKTLSEGIQEVQDLIEQSTGVNLCGEVTRWPDFMPGGQYEDWLIKFNLAVDLVEQLEKPRSSERVK